jgi:hypothetical protein
MISLWISHFPSSTLVHSYVISVLQVPEVGFHGWELPTDSMPSFAKIVWPNQTLFFDLEFMVLDNTGVNYIFST